MDNYTSISEIARDFIMNGFVEPTNEHVFLSRTAWAKAVKERDGYLCQDCGSFNDVDAHHIQPVYQGGINVLSNGVALCAFCHAKRHTTETYAPYGYEVPNSWILKKHSANGNQTGKDFWRYQLACFMTKRKNARSSIVQKYVDDYLTNIPEEVIIKTLLKLCPTPNVIRNMPNVPSNAKKENFEPPPLVT